MSKIKLSCYYCGNEIGTGYNTSNIGFCAASCFADLILQAANKVEYQEEQADDEGECTGIDETFKAVQEEQLKPLYSYKWHCNCGDWHTDKQFTCPKDKV